MERRIATASRASMGGATEPGGRGAKWGLRAANQRASGPLQARVKCPVLLGLVAAALCACAGPVGAPGELPQAATTPRFDAALVATGANLAVIGNCRGCHTSPEGPPLGGGTGFTTGFGTIYSTNISPDPETGIGKWSEAAFARAMREGLDREGRHLYPAFPYDHFTRVTDADDRAIYAYLMAQPPVVHRPPRNRLLFPFNVRESIAAWKMLYFEPGPKPLVNSDPVLARGEYLVEGLGHCASCHTPRNALQAEKRDQPYAGGEAEGWHAYALNHDNAAPLPWTVDALAHYLRTGWAEGHGIARGTMGSVTVELANADPRDLRAMAAYVASLMRGGAGASKNAAAMRVGAGDGSEGARIFGTTCEGCHDGSTPLPYGGMPLGLSIGVTGESPRNLVNVVLHGIPAAPGSVTSPQMPGYGRALDDAQVEALVQWMRANLSGRPPWTGVSATIRASRAMDPELTRFPPGGTGTDPAAKGQQ